MDQKADPMYYDDQHQDEVEVPDHSPLPFAQLLWQSEVVWEGLGTDLQQLEKVHA